MLNRILTIIFSLLLFALFGYLIYVRYDTKEEIRITSFEIDISGQDSISFINKELVEEWLYSDECNISIGTPIESVDFDSVESYIIKQDFINEVNISSDIFGLVSLEIHQATPKFKLLDSNGNTLYIDSLFNAYTPNFNYAMDLQLVCCHDELFNSIKESGKKEKNVKKDDENYYFLNNLINFVGYVEKDEFWSSQITLISVTESGVIELTPRVGNHRIIMCETGELGGYKNYLNKLKVIYKKVIPRQGWKTYSLIDLTYNNQAICRGEIGN